MNTYDKLMAKWLNGDCVDTTTYFGSKNRLYTFNDGRSTLFAVKDSINKTILYTKANVDTKHIERLIAQATALEYHSFYTNYKIADTNDIVTKTDFIIEACKSLIFDYFKKNIISLLNPANKQTHRCNIDVTTIYTDYLYAAIKDFYIKHHEFLETDNSYSKLTGIYWDNQCCTFLNKLDIISINTKLPTLWDIIKNKVFTSTTTNALYRYYIYDKYCFGKHITYKELCKNIDTTFNFDRLIKTLALNNIFITQTYNFNVTSYIDELKLLNKIIYDTNRNAYFSAVSTSRTTLEQAKKEIAACMQNDHFNDGKGFRESKCSWGHPISRQYVEIRLINGQTYKYKLIPATLEDFKPYKTPQFRMLYNGNIYTSANKEIHMNAFIEFMKVLHEEMKKYKQYDRAYRLSLDKAITVGHNELSGIGFIDKACAHPSFNTKDWYVIINKVHYWLADIISFITDEHLEQFNYLINEKHN